MPLTLMISALFAGQVQLVDFLTDHNYCFGVRSSDGKPSWDHKHGESSPISQLIQSWLQQFPKNFEYHIFDSVVNGNWTTFSHSNAGAHSETTVVFTAIPGARYACYTQFTAERANGGFSRLHLDACVSTADTCALRAGRSDTVWHDIVRALEQRMPLKGPSTKVHTIQLVHLHAVISKWLVKLTRPLLRCFTPELLSLGDGTGNTPLHYAARPGGVDAFRQILGAGAKISAQNSNGKHLCLLVHAGAHLCGCVCKSQHGCCRRTHSNARGGSLRATRARRCAATGRGVRAVHHGQVWVHSEAYQASQAPPHDSVPIALLLTLHLC